MPRSDEPRGSQATAAAAKSENSGGVQVIRRVAQILDAIRESPEGLSLAQLAERTGIARSTVHRLVTALVAEGLLATANRNGRLRPGPTIIAFAAAGARDVVLDFHPVMSRLSRDLNETVDLAVLEYDRVRFLHQVAASRRLHAVSFVGAIFPAHCSANGKALLARSPIHDLERLLPERLDALTPNTIIERDVLMDELEQVRESGLAFDREEHSLGICAVGTALTTPEGGAVAMTVAVPAQRFYGNEERLAKELLSARRKLERGQSRATRGAGKKQTTESKPGPSAPHARRRSTA